MEDLSKISKETGFSLDGLKSIKILLEPLNLPLDQLDETMRLIIIGSKLSRLSLKEVAKGTISVLTNSKNSGL